MTDSQRVTYTAVTILAKKIKNHLKDHLGSALPRTDPHCLGPGLVWLKGELMWHVQCGSKYVDELEAEHRNDLTLFIAWIRQTVRAERTRQGISLRATLHNIFFFSSKFLLFSSEFTQSYCIIRVYLLNMKPDFNLYSQRVRAK